MHNVDNITWAGDTSVTSSTADYANMSKDLFNKLNLLKTTPTTEQPTYTGTARTSVANLFTSVKPALQWSQSLSQSVLHYINLVGTN